MFSRFKFKCWFPFRSTWEQLIIWQPLAISTLPWAIVSKIFIFHLVYIKYVPIWMVLQWFVEMQWKSFEKDWKAAKNNRGRAAFLEMLEAAVISQRFPCIRKLILQENFQRHIQIYAFFVWSNRNEALSRRYY